MTRRAVVLLSGGIDSATVLAVAHAEGFECHALSFDYGQSHRYELQCASRVASSLHVEDHIVMKIDLSLLARSALTGEGELPTGRDIEQIGKGIPDTYVPARNTIFLSLALARAESLDASDIFIGASAVDYSGYPDCRPRYIESFEQLANLATKRAVEGRRTLIRAPLIDLSKSEIIKLGNGLGVDYSLTSSCYRPGPGGEQCGVCDSCILRRKGFEEASLADPAAGR